MPTPPGSNGHSPVFALDPHHPIPQNPVRKILLGLFLTLLIFAAVFGGGALLWYLSATTEFSIKGGTPPPSHTPAENR